MDRDLLNEARKIDYGLRSTFFYRKLSELGFYGFKDEIEKLIKIERNYNWAKRFSWGVSKKAWAFVTKSNVAHLRIFAHPRIIIEQPKLIAYYRNVAVLPQKGVQALAFDIKRFEKGSNRIGLTQRQAEKLCILFNSHISTILESATEINELDVDGLLFASAGAQINGSWLNSIGAEAENVVKRFICKYVIDNKLVTAITDADQNTLSLKDVDIATDSQKIRVLKLKNQTSVIFSSDPDISLRAKDGSLVAAIEVKGGKDPAGALERYGAAKKSFEKALRENHKTYTIFLASCITDEVAKRIKRDKTVSGMVNLTVLLFDEGKREKFIRYLLSLLK